MTHFLKDSNGNKYEIEMGCNHPDMQDNTTESVGCTGNCASYQYSVATCSIPEMLRLIELAGLVK